MVYAEGRGKPQAGGGKRYAKTSSSMVLKTEIPD
jgi:hypothetical protein